MSLREAMNQTAPMQTALRKSATALATYHQLHGNDGRSPDSIREQQRPVLAGELQTSEY